MPIELRQWCRERGYRFVTVFNRWGYREPIPNYDPAIHGTDSDRYLITEENAAEVDAWYKERSHDVH